MRETLWVLFVLTVGASGCMRSGAAAEETISTPPHTAAVAVTKIVFVGKENACECTLDRVNAVWATLHKVLGKPAKLPVERLQLDTQAENVAVYRVQKPMMALPALYFVDAKNKVVDLLQGEVTEAQLAAALGR